MPWTASSGKTYKLCLLDTNALSEIVKRLAREGRGFVEEFPPSSWVPCWTIYNLIELRRAVSVYEQWLSVFSVYPSFVLKPFQDLLSDEVAAYASGADVCPLLHAFTPFAADQSYHLRSFVDKLFNQPVLASLERTRPNELQKTLEIWLAQKANFAPTSESANARDGDSYALHAGVETVGRLHPEWLRPFHESGEIPDLDPLPSLKVMLYSQYYRLYDPCWSPRPQEATDVEIMAATPYMDAVVTENFQGEVLKKIRHKVRGLDRLRVARLRDLR